jgi:hypothetical protein
MQGADWIPDFFEAYSTSVVLLCVGYAAGGLDTPGSMKRWPQPAKVRTSIFVQNKRECAWPFLAFGRPPAQTGDRACPSLHNVCQFTRIK